MLSLSKIESAELADYIEEVDALIDADDEGIFTLPFIEKHDRIKEILYAQS